MVQRDEIHDIDLSIRFKHGTHSIFLFVDPMAPFEDLAEELLDVLRERYPDGLNTSVAPPQTTSLPDDANKIEFAVPKSASDLTLGWSPLNVSGQDTPASKGLKDGSVVAFAIRPDDADEEDEVEFLVDFPSYDDDYDEEGA